MLNWADKVDPPGLDNREYIFSELALPYHLKCLAKHKAMDIGFASNNEFCRIAH